MSIQDRIRSVELAIEDVQGMIEGLEISDVYDEEMFSDSMNDEHGDVSILGYEFDPVAALYELDPTSYYEEYNNWLDTLNIEESDEWNDLNDELRDLQEELEELMEELEEEESE